MVWMPVISKVCVCQKRMKNDALLIPCWCCHFNSRQLASEVWRLQRQKRLGLGAGLRSRGACGRYVALHSRKEDKWGLASQLAKPDSGIPSSLLVFGLRSQEIQPSVLSSCSTLSSVTLAQHYDEPGCFCKVGNISRHIFIYSEQWDVICMHSNMHISVFFQGIICLHFCCFSWRCHYVASNWPFSPWSSQKLVLMMNILQYWSMGYYNETCELFYPL